MRRNLVILFIAGLATLASPPATAATCEPGSETRHSLKRLDINGIFGDQLLAQQKAILTELLAQNPDDVFLNLRYEQMASATTDAERTTAIARYKELADSHAGNPDYAFFYAASLVGFNTPDAIARLRALASGTPAYPLAFLKLSRIYSWGKFADHAESRSQLNLFLDACPASFNSEALGLLGGSATPEMASKYAPTLRERLMMDTDPDRIRVWETIWSLEFKACPPTEHAGVRKQIANDLVRIEQNPASSDEHRLFVLRAGYKMVDDEAALRRIEDRIVAEDPNGYEARESLQDRWSKDHPYPRPGAARSETQVFLRAQLQFVNERLKVSPGDSVNLDTRFNALSSLDDSTTKQVVDAAKALQTALRNGADWWSYIPVEFEIADAYLKRRAHVNEVPALVAAGWKTHRSQPGNRVTSDLEPDEYRKDSADRTLFLKMQAARILLNAAQQLKKPAIAKDAMDALADAKPEKPDSQSTLWELKAKWAELNGRKLDALLMYRTALDHRSQPLEPASEDDLTTNFARLWNELGGSAETEKLLVKRPAPTAVVAGGRWEDPKKDMPAWQLSDLAGHTWTAASLHGKTVLINVWATWCGPCRQEHPLLQSLYDKNKDRSDIQILTFDIDEEIGDVAPYMGQHKFTFPVLLASEYVNDLLPEIGIPRLWIVDASGKWRWEQVGLADDAKWEGQVLEKLKQTEPQ